MRVNGGQLDEVIFAVKTQKQEDLDYLEELLLEHKEYSKHVASTEYNIGLDKYENLKLDWFGDGMAPNWHDSWGAVSDPNTIYVKIDDDVVSS